MEFNEISAWSPAGASPGESASFGRLYFGKAPAAVVERLLPGRCAEGVNTAEVALRDLSGKGTRARVVLSTQTESGDLIETTSQDVALEPGGAQTIQLNYKIPPAVRKCYLAATLLSQPRARVIDGLEMALEAPEKEVALEMVQSDFIRGWGPIRAVVDINKGSVSVGAYGLKVEVLREKNVLADCVIERLDSQRVEVVIQDPSLTPGSYMLRARLLEDKKVAAEATKDMEILKGPFDK
jgi:hypothetical protein